MLEVYSKVLDDEGDFIDVSRRDGQTTWCPGSIHYTNISKYELDKNEPPLAILLAYARLVGIPVEQIIDDELELPI